MKYTALTIGPIIQSLGLARKTREIWAVSYFFSHLMELVTEELSDYKIIIPEPNKSGIGDTLNLSPNNYNRTGLFPDRLMLESEDGLYDKLQAAVHSAIGTICKLCFLPQIDSVKFEEYLQSYLTASIIEVDEDKLPWSGEKGHEIKNVIVELNKYLANTELQQKYIHCDEQLFLRFIEAVNQTDLYKYKYPGDSFPSIIEIATRNLEINATVFEQKDEEEDKTWDRILEIEADEKQKVETGILQKQDCKLFGKLKQANKYIVMVQADGDNVGKLISKIYEGNSSKIEAFSKALSTFALSAANIIQKWGGEAIYAGGDDLLFFAPIANKNESNFFDLIEELDDEFRVHILENSDLSGIVNNLKPQPSMSYGVSISYYKFPMHEALKTAQSLLFNDAKSGEKNAVAFQLLKHSGQSYKTILNKNYKIYEYLKIMLSDYKGLPVHSVLHNFQRDGFVLEEVITEKEKLKNFFNNFYNEDIHDKEELKKHKIFLVDMLSEVYHDNFEIAEKELEEAKKKNKKSMNAIVDTKMVFQTTLNQIISAMQLVKFINTKSHD